MSDPHASPSPETQPAPSAFERGLEWSLWQTRWMILVPVLALLVSAASFVLQAVHDVWSALHAHSSTEALVLHIEAMDASLLAAALVIFALGLYELFISKMDVRFGHESGDVLHISSLDDLKSKLAKIILMLLVVKFFKRAQSIPAETQLDMLMFAGGVVGMAVALYLVKGKQE